MRQSSGEQGPGPRVDVDDSDFRALRDEMLHQAGADASRAAADEHGPVGQARIGGERSHDVARRLAIAETVEWPSVTIT